MGHGHINQSGVSQHSNYPENWQCSRSESVVMDLVFEIKVEIKWRHGQTNQSGVSAHSNYPQNRPCSRPESLVPNLRFLLPGLPHYELPLLVQDFRLDPLDSLDSPLVPLHFQISLEKKCKPLKILEILPSNFEICLTFCRLRYFQLCLYKTLKAPEKKIGSLRSWRSCC